MFHRLVVERGGVFIDGYGREDHAAITGKAVRMALDRGSLAGMRQVFIAQKIPVPPHCREQFGFDRPRPLGIESRVVVTLCWIKVACLACGLIDHAVELLDGRPDRGLRCRVPKSLSLLEVGDLLVNPRWQASPARQRLFARINGSDRLNRRELGKRGLPSKGRNIPELVAADHGLRILPQCLIQEMPRYPLRLPDERVGVYLVQLGAELLFERLPLGDRRSWSSHPAAVPDSGNATLPTQAARRESRCLSGAARRRAAFRTSATW